MGAIVIMCRSCYMRRKTGLVQFLQAATTSVMSVIHAWQFKCQACLAMILSLLMILPKKSMMLPVWEVVVGLTHLHKGTTGTPITSHWGGNATVVATSSILNRNFYLHNSTPLEWRLRLFPSRVLICKMEISHLFFFVLPFFCWLNK